MIAVTCGLAASPAAAAPSCPYGQLYRVHLRECVKLGTPLALAYEGNVSHRRINLKLQNRRKNITQNIPNQPDPPPDPPADDPPTALDALSWQLAPLLEAAGRRWAHMVAPPTFSPSVIPQPGPWPSLSRPEAWPE